MKNQCLLFFLLVALVACNNSEANRDSILKDTSQIVELKNDDTSSQVAIQKVDSIFTRKTKARQFDTISKAKEVQNVFKLPNVPHFSDSEVNNGIQAFASSMQEKVMALQAHDTAKLKILKEKLEDMPSRMTMWFFKMSSEERDAFKAYLERVTKIAKEADKS